MASTRKNKFAPKRQAYLCAKDLRLGIKPVRVWGYGRDGKFTCRLEISSAGVAVFTGKVGLKRTCNLTWEQLVEKLSKQDTP